MCYCTKKIKKKAGVWSVIPEKAVWPSTVIGRLDEMANRRALSHRLSRYDALHLETYVQRVALARPQVRKKKSALSTLTASMRAKRRNYRSKITKTEDYRETGQSRRTCHMCWARLGQYASKSLSRTNGLMPGYLSITKCLFRRR